MQLPRGGTGYIVVDTGPWIFGSKVLIPAGAITEVDSWTRRYISSVKEQIKNAPEYIAESARTTQFWADSGRTTSRCSELVANKSLGGEISRDGWGSLRPVPSSQKVILHETRLTLSSRSTDLAPSLPGSGRRRARIRLCLHLGSLPPWIGAQGHSPFVWSVLGGIAAATENIEVGVGVSCPYCGSIQPSSPRPWRPLVS